jgi:hypothetical protein
MSMKLALSALSVFACSLGASAFVKRATTPARGAPATVTLTPGRIQLAIPTPGRCDVTPVPARALPGGVSPPAKKRLASINRAPLLEELRQTLGESTRRGVGDPVLGGWGVEHRHHRLDGPPDQDLVGPRQGQRRQPPRRPW